MYCCFFFFSSRRRHTRFDCDWSSDVCSSDLRVMIHQPMGGFQGQASDVEIHAKEILYLRSRLNEIMAKHTGQSVDKISRDTDRDNFLSADEAVKFGIVDKVLTSRAETAAAAAAACKRSDEPKDPR